MTKQALFDLLEEKVAQYNQQGFIEDDPISIPHRFALRQDVEISAFFAAMLAWGRRTTIISKVTSLLHLMDDAPYDFVCNHNEHDLIPFQKFVHRTFQPTDALYFIDFLQRHYLQHTSLEEAFGGMQSITVKDRLSYFHSYFFDTDYAPNRTRKHISTPLKKSACKRLNMFLRWMVRKDDASVDFGLWNTIDPADLMIPLDVHVARISAQLGLLKRTKNDWLAVEELSENLRRFDPQDPIKYDFALFGMGVNEDVF